MTPAAIASSLIPYLQQSPALPAPFFSQLSTYLEILLRWNARTNLTSLRTPEEIVTRHFGESLDAAQQIFKVRDPQAGNPQTLADIGSGAGFPGIPIKLWTLQVELPLHVTLIESHQKKATFLREVIRALQIPGIEIPGIEVQAVRAEQIARTFDVVTLRAVENFEEILQTAANLVKPGGRIALLIGEDQIPAAKTALETFKWKEPTQIPNSHRRVVLLGQSPGRT